MDTAGGVNKEEESKFFSPSINQKTKKVSDKRRILFDIETSGKPIESFTEEQQRYLLKGVKNEEEMELAVKGLNLHPLTAEIVCIGMIDVDRSKAGIYYQSDEKDDWESENGLVKYHPSDEKNILIKFWDIITRYNQFITFNGRSFDCPFILLRSAFHKLAPTRNLMPYRYDANQHCDLLDQLTFYGATRKFNLDFYCRFFGIESPKSHGITGLDMNELFRGGRFKDIAEYCYGDIKATSELFHIWDKYINTIINPSQHLPLHQTA